jgi:hypothetical protein
MLSPTLKFFLAFIRTSVTNYTKEYSLGFSLQHYVSRTNASTNKSLKTENYSEWSIELLFLQILHLQAFGTMLFSSGLNNYKPTP